MIDKILPVLVGHRTEVLALGAAVLQLLGAFGVIDPVHTKDVLGVLVPLAGATFAAKVSRLTPDTQTTPIAVTTKPPPHVAQTPTAAP